MKSYYGWEKKGKEVELDLQHVIRLGYEVNEGISDVFPKQINSGDAFSHTVELNLPKNIQDYKNLKLIAFVIDRNSKYVENVVEVPIKEMQPTETAIRDINNVETPAITLPQWLHRRTGFRWQDQRLHRGRQGCSEHQPQARHVHRAPD